MNLERGEKGAVILKETGEAFVLESDGKKLVVYGVQRKVDDRMFSNVRKVMVPAELEDSFVDWVNLKGGSHGKTEQLEEGDSQDTGADISKS